MLTHKRGMYGGKRVRNTQKVVVILWPHLFLTNKGCNNKKQMVGPEGTAGVEFDRPPQEACGLFAVHLRRDSAWGPIATELAASGIAQLGHRGDEGTGIAIYDEDMPGIWGTHGAGDAKAAFGENGIAGMDSWTAMAHGRYATSNMDSVSQAASAKERRKALFSKIQPMFYETESHGRISLAHNGDIKNAKELAELFGYDPNELASDSQLALFMLADTLDAGQEPVEAIRHVSHLMVGAFCMNALIDTSLYAWRDPWGFRPLFLGEFKDGEEVVGWTTASEQPAFEVLGGRELRSVERGELVEITDDGVQSHELFTPEELQSIPPSLCIFEFVYFARPDTRLNGQSVGMARVRSGEILAREAPVPEDTIIVGSPNSGLPAAEGFAFASGKRMLPGLVKNPRDPRRSFMQPGQTARREVKALKTNVDRAIVDGASVARVDDSAVRGHTSQGDAEKLLGAGATEVHERIASPPYKHPCHFGMDTKVPEHLIASQMTEEEMQEHFGVDSLAFLSLRGLFEAIGAPADGAGYCTNCMTGEDPTETEVQLTARRRYIETIVD